MINDKDTWSLGTFPTPSFQLLLALNLQLNAHHRRRDVPPKPRGGVLREIMTPDECENAKGKYAVNGGYEKSQTDIGKEEVEAHGIGKFQEKTREQ